MIIKVLHTISHRLHTVVVVRLAVVVVVYKAATAAGSTCLKIYRIIQHMMPQCYYHMHTKYTS